jgi:molybdopterin-guanine dinucleotide biosynthesis protein A
MASEDNQTTPERIDSLYGAVLTGGASRRMERDKATLEIADQPLAQRAVTVLQEVFADVVVVSSGLSAHTTFGVPVIEDRYPNCGPLGGLHAALQEASAAAPRRDVFLLACDMPFVSPALVRFLATLGSSIHSETAWACVPRMNEGLEPLCAVYSAGCLEPAAAALDERSFKMHEFLDRLETRRVEITPELPFFDCNLFSNINRPGDLLEICEQVEPMEPNDLSSSRNAPVVKT